MKGLVVALQFLTRLPTPRVTVSQQDFAAAMRWFPAAGAIVGAVVALAAWGGAQVDPWLGALAGLAAWVLVTGALHLDGLGDIADGLGAAHKGPDRLREVLADPHVGSFAVVAIGLQLAAKLVLLRMMIEGGQFAAIVAVPFAARIGPLVWSRLLPPLHPGLAARFADAVQPIDLGIWTAMLLLAAVFVPGVLAAIPAILLWSGYLRRRLGGISGDGHGAGIELTETALLLALVVAARLA